MWAPNFLWKRLSDLLLLGDKSRSCFSFRAKQDTGSICNSGLPKLHTGSGTNRVSGIYLWTKPMMPRPRHTASPWQSQPRGRGSRCLAPSSFQQPGSLLVTQGCLPKHDGLSGERSPGHHPCPLLGGLCSHILTLVGLTGWTASWGKSGKSRSGVCPWWGADRSLSQRPALSSWCTSEEITTFREHRRE